MNVRKRNTYNRFSTFTVVVVAAVAAAAVADTIHWIKNLNAACDSRHKNDETNLTFDYNITLAQWVRKKGHFDMSYKRGQYAMVYQMRAENQSSFSLPLRREREKEIVTKISPYASNDDELRNTRLVWPFIDHITTSHTALFLAEPWSLRILCSN